MFDDEFYERDIDWKRDADEWERRTADPVVTEVCPFCNYLWSIHDNSRLDSIKPFGCPESETVAVQLWGRS